MLQTFHLLDCSGHPLLKQNRLQITHQVILLFQSLSGWASLRASQQADLSFRGVILSQKGSVVHTVKCLVWGICAVEPRESWVPLCVHAAPEGSVWRYSMCCVSSGFCMFERVGMRWRECGLTPDPPDYPVASGAEKYRAFLPALPTPLTKSHSEEHFSHQIPNTQLYSFLAEDQEKWVFTWEGAWCWWPHMWGHNPVHPAKPTAREHTDFCHTNQPVIPVCVGYATRTYTHFTTPATNN